MISRRPPKHIQERLRKEANFGCPIKDCGVPYLMYHHFDPPWREKQHHNPEGMIALCPTHAYQADGDRWTKAQLKQIKQNPYISLGEMSNVYNYLRKNVVCFIGNVAYNVKNILEINGERVIGFERDENGYDRLNLLIRDEKGSPILVMENNDWTTYNRELYDLRCSTQGKELEIKSNDNQTNLQMRFDDHPLEKFKKILSKGFKISYKKMINDMKKRLADTTFLERALSQKQLEESVNKVITYIGSPDFVPTWTIKGRLKWGSSYIEIRDFEVEDLLSHHIFSMGVVIDSPTAFSFSGRARPT